MSESPEFEEFDKLALETLEAMVRVLAQVDETPMREHRVSLSDWSLLRVLARGEQVRAGGLGYLVGLQRTDAKTACYVLEKKGLVTVDDRDDGVGVALEISLTTAGRELLAALDERLVDLFRAEFAAKPNMLKGMRWGSTLLLGTIKKTFQLEPVAR